jgi:hypothetical protein
MLVPLFIKIEVENKTLRQTPFCPLKVHNSLALFDYFFERSIFNVNLLSLLLDDFNKGLETITFFISKMIRSVSS